MKRPRSERRQRTVMLAARALPDEAEAIRAEAKRRGVSVSALLVRSALDNRVQS